MPFQVTLNIPDRAIRFIKSESKRRLNRDLTDDEMQQVLQIIGLESFKIDSAEKWILRAHTQYALKQIGLIKSIDLKSLKLLKSDRTNS